MNKDLRCRIVLMMFRIDWRKLFFVGAIFIVTSVALQISALPGLTTLWNRSQAPTHSLYKPGNATMDPTKHSHGEQFETVVHTSMNSTAKFNQSVPLIGDGQKISQSRRLGSNAKRREIVSIPSPPKNRTVAHELLKCISSLRPDEALAYAKKEVENAPVVTHDPDLHTPLFHNISMFKRSYEMMELILKVYIYQEGKKPIFHQPQLRGIYSSEGWFMKLLQENRKFVVKDPKKAHLFYLPYSARQLQRALYVPNSHNIESLSIYLRDYVNMLTGKYPFWNRTHGSDHFLVACHDWGSYTLTAHEELTKNAIKALCNADVSEGIFVAEHDVSLPETMIRNPRKPLRNIGGKRVSQRPILAFFAGHTHGRVRPRLLKYWSDKDEDVRIYGPLPNRVSRVMNYVQHMKSSKYCICPMGYEVNSPRIVEAIYYECVPVIIADNFTPPLSEVFDWSAFSVIVAEKDIPKLKEILLSIPLRRYQTMQLNVKMLQRHFLWNPSPVRYDLFHMILHSIWFR